jgi:hypothetical protein
VIIDDLNVDASPLRNSKQIRQPPLTVIAHCFFRSPFNLCKPTLRNGTEIMEALGNVQSRQQIDCGSDIKATELI